MQPTRILLPDGITFSVAQHPARPGRYDAVQKGDAGDFDAEAWRSLRRQMETANYASGPAVWRDGYWHCRFRPTPRLWGFARWSRHRLGDWLTPIKGSPRAAAPRFDGEFFGNWIRRLTALGLFSTIFAVLVQTATRIEAIRTAQPAEWDATPNAGLVLFLIGMFQALVTVILCAITFDLAYYTARRLYRATGLPVPVATAFLSLLIGGLGVGLFLVAEGSRQILMELER